jgi:signal transduction histidine kinase
VKLALTMLAPPLGFALAARYRGFGAAATILILTPLALVSATGPQAAVNWRDLPPMATLMHLFLIVVAATCWILAAISRQLKWAVAEAVEAEKRKARFVATINHELRTPLNAILGFAELMRLQELKEDSAAVDDIQNSGKRLLAMVERVLSQSDRGASVFQLNRQRIRLNTIFVRVLEDVRPECERAGCTIEVATPPDLLVTVDPRALRQMLLVLMSQPLRRSSAGSSILISGLRSPAGVVIEVQADGLSEGAQDSRDKLEIQLLNALALAQGGRLEMVREGRASRLARLTLFEDRAQLDRSGGNRGIAG